MLTVYNNQLNRQQKTKPLNTQGLCLKLAEAVRFELTEGYQPSTVFKTVALNRSATPPVCKLFSRLAEAVRFELTEGYQPSTVFKTVALNRSATLPFPENVNIIGKQPLCQAFLTNEKVVFCFYLDCSLRKNTHSFSFEAARLNA